MASLNKVHIIGRLTRDPELRVTPRGTSICAFGVAVNRQYKDESGASRDETTFIDCEAWGKTGELVAKYLGKGAFGYFEGRLKLDQWDDKQSGQKRSKIKVVVENVQFLGKSEGKRDQQPNQQGDEPHEERKAERPLNAKGQEVDHEDVPF